MTEQSVSANGSLEERVAAVVDNFMAEVEAGAIHNAQHIPLGKLKAKGLSRRRLAGGHSLRLHLQG